MNPHLQNPGPRLWTIPTPCVGLDSTRFAGWDFVGAEDSAMEEDYAVIVALHGERILVDKDDFDWLSKMRWRADGKKGKKHTRYATTKGGCENSMHRLILNAKDGEFVDHINHDGLDNRRANLRLCTKSQNGQNAMKRRTSSSSKYKGVSYNKANGCKRKWQASIRHKKLEYLGVFDTEEEAALAYNEAAKQRFGEFACLNVIESAKPQKGK